MGVNFLIAALKFGAWLVSRSPSMLSEALHSLGDGTNSVALMLGIRLGSREPDKTHPYGYGLEANVWALAACMMLLVFSVVAIWEGFTRLFEPNEPIVLTPPWDFLDPFMLSVTVLVISIFLEILAVQKATHAVLTELGIEFKDLWSDYVRAFRNLKKVVGPTTRFVFYEESVALLGAILALMAISLSHFAELMGFLASDIAHRPDAITSVIIGFMLMGMAIYLFVHNRSILTGTAVAPSVEHKIRTMVTNLHAVSEVHDLVAIDRGPAGLSVHMTVEVEPDTLVKDVDDLTDRIKEKIQHRVSNVSQVIVEVLADESDIEWGEKFNALIEQGRAEGIIKPREELILKNVYDFTQATVEDIMVPRTDVTAIEIAMSLEEVADIVVESGHSRFPVFREKLDNLEGMIHARDLFARIHQGLPDTPISEIIRHIDIYPENKPVSDLLEEFKRNKIQMAAVADEHGGFAGVVTIEDLMEEIVGDIWDEHDVDDYVLEMVSPTLVLLSGKYDIEDLNDRLNLNFPTQEFATIGGFVFGELGREPEEGDQVSFEDLMLTVTEVDGPRIITIQIESPDPFRDREKEETGAVAASGEIAGARPDQTESA